MSNTPTDSVNALSQPKFDHTIRSNLDLEGVLESLLALGDLHLGLDAHDATTPLLAGVLVLLDVALLDGRDELGELVLVLSADLGESEDGSGLEKTLLVHCVHTSCRCGMLHTFLWTTVPRRALPLMMA